ncbi:hypothetical protein GGS23DRAFT_601112 [Durotheca rogersii]|uniref:uncharacterized protein n=1 Tax=Durotheca rogersii TaxID=419775 RepID=UPI0022209C33|nr:uncharacterized protein GGS23DRAFT_601112 [Durotheca rogersii]KAI5856702.1 hypothetical protein GGS23DRAFT_601112 [Durotheca rogersii]
MTRSRLPMSTSVAALTRYRQPARPSTSSPDSSDTPQPTASSSTLTGGEDRLPMSTSSPGLSADFNSASSSSLGQPMTPNSSVPIVTDPEHPAYNHPGPLTSNPIATDPPVTSLMPRRILDVPVGPSPRPVAATGDLPIPLLYNGGESRVAPADASSTKASTAAACMNATAVPHIRIENVPPHIPTGGLSAKNKNSLDTVHTRVPPMDISISKPGLEQQDGIPRARTFGNMLSNFAAPFARSTTCADLHSHGEAAHDVSLPQTVGGGTIGIATDARNYIVGPASTPRAQSPAFSPPSRLNGVRLIYAAQDSAYWAGRFTALMDRFKSENLPGALSAAVNAHTEKPVIPPGKGGKPQISLPLSHTMTCVSGSGVTPSALESAKPIPRSERRQRRGAAAAASPSFLKPGLSSEAATLLSDEDSRARRAFLHLETLCVTNEARKSLHSWQNDYARCMGKPYLLPKAKFADGKTRGWVGRLFNGGKKGH